LSFIPFRVIIRARRDGGVSAPAFAHDGFSIGRAARAM